MAAVSTRPSRVVPIYSGGAAFQSYLISILYGSLPPYGIIARENHGLWDVTMERSDHENFTDEEWTKLRQTFTGQAPPVQPLPTVA